VASLAAPWWRPVLAASLVAAVALALFPLVRETPVTSSVDSYTEAEVQLALEQVKWTLGRVSQVGRDTGMLLRDEIVKPHVVGPIRRSLVVALPTPPLSNR
jgi:hypothetical protein